jgi:hypothetical protein
MYMKFTERMHNVNDLSYLYMYTECIPVCCLYISTLLYIFQPSLARLYDFHKEVSDTLKCAWTQD